MNTHTITKEQLAKIVESIDALFESYFSKPETKEKSIKSCFYQPEMYEHQGLWALKDDALSDFPDEIKEKTHEMIATISSVD